MAVGTGENIMIMKLWFNVHLPLFETIQGSGFWNKSIQNMVWSGNRNAWNDRCWRRSFFCLQHWIYTLLDRFQHVAVSIHRCRGQIRHPLSDKTRIALLNLGHFVLSRSRICRQTLETKSQKHKTLHNSSLGTYVVFAITKILCFQRYYLPRTKRNKWFKNVY